MTTTPIKSFKHSLGAFISILLGCLILTGCDPCLICKFNPKIKLCDCGCGRRPPVIESEYPYVLDYWPDDECNFKEEDEEDGIPITPEMTDTDQPILDEYRIAIGDVLEISVFGDEDTMVQNAIVAPDGRIYYLFMDGIIAEGKTVKELRTEVEKGLSKMFLAPTVSIIPQLMTKNTFTILGRVRTPGLYPLNHTVTIRQAIGLAGGLLLEPDVMNPTNVSNRSFVRSAAPGRLYLQATSGSNESIFNLENSFIVRNGEKIHVDFEHLVYSGDETQNVVLRPGDYIYIAPDENREVFVMGAVNGPAAIPYQKDMTVLQALATVGGWRRGGPYAADPSNVLILRGNLDCPTVARLDLCALASGAARDIPLQPGDILYLHDKKLRFGRELVYLAVTGFLISFMNDAGIEFANEHIPEP